MTKTIIQKDFRTLRQAYAEVKTFIEKETCVTVDTLDTRIEADLGCAGDDNLELLEKFVTKYNLAADGFDYSKHFLSEGELSDAGILFLQLIILPIRITAWLLKLITFGKLDLTRIEGPKFNRFTTDLSFGDMLTWYLSGNYCVRSNAQVQLARAI